MAACRVETEGEAMESETLDVSTVCHSALLMTMTMTPN